MKPFESPRLLIARAGKHISELRALEAAYRQQNPYVLLQEDDPKTGDCILKARITAEIPKDAPAVVFDVVNCLRSALDHAVFDASIELGGAPKPKYTKFPFGRTADDAANDLPRKRAEVPESIRPYLLSFKPYEGGNRPLWALNEMRNGKIHQTLVASVAATMIGFNGTFDYAKFDMMHVWDRAKNEVAYMRIGRGAKMKAQFEVTPLIAFAEGSALAGPAVSTLDHLRGICVSIFQGIEAETARLLR